MPKKKGKDALKSKKKILDLLYGPGVYDKSLTSQGNKVLSLKDVKKKKMQKEMMKELAPLIKENQERINAIQAQQNVIKNEERKKRKIRKSKRALAGGKLLETVRTKMEAENPKALEKDVPKKYEETKKKISDQKGGTKGSGPKGGGGGAGSIGFLKLVTPPYKKFSKGGRVKKNVDGIAKKGKTKGRMI